MKKIVNKVLLFVLFMCVLTLRINARVLNVETSGVSETSGFYGGTIARNKVESISFVDGKSVPSGVLGSYDASKEKDGSIMVWYKDANNNELYEVYVGSNSGINAPAKTEYLFKGFTNVKRIDIGKLNMASVSDISKTFANLSKLEKISVKKSNALKLSGFKSSVSSKNILLTVGIDSSKVDGIKDKDKKDKTGLIVTGDYLGENRVVVLGDINSDGKISSLDYVKTKNHIMSSNLITDSVQLIAADYNEDDKISSLDYVKTKNYIMSGSTKKYEVSFNINGGTGDTISYVEVEKGKAMPKISGIPTYEGKSFLGWFDTSDYKIGAQYYDANLSSAKNYDKDDDLILYAGWEKSGTTPTYAVIFNANGGSGTMANQNIAANKSTALNANKFTNAGYTFKEWNTSSDGKGTSYADKANITITGSKTLYAIWEANTYTINYYLGNGKSTAGSTKIGTSTCKYKESCTLSTFASFDKTFPNSENLWSFNGWSVKKSSAEVTYANAAKFTYETADDLDIYAVGRRTFRFSTGVDPKTNLGEVYQYWVPYSTSTDYVTSIKIPNSTAITGWTFVGYRETTDATSTVTYAASKQDTSVKPGPTTYTNLDFKSIYSRKLTLKYDANGGTGSISNVTKDQYYNSGFGNGTSNSGANVSTATFKLAKASAYTNTGYTLTNWAEGSTTGTKHVPEGSFNWAPAVTASDTVTMYAIWNITGYTISFDLNGGTGTVPGNLTATHNAAMPKLTATAPTKEGYTFLGWYNNADYTKGTQYYKPDNSSIRVFDKTADLKLYAGWVKNGTTPKYNIDFDANGGTGTMSSQAVSANTSTAINANKFTKEGYAFKEWNTSADGKGTSYADKANISISEGVILYAQWENATYTINYYLGNGKSTAGSTKIGTSTCKYKGSCTLSTFASFDKAFPNSENLWTFNGWSSTKNGTTIAYTDGAKFTYETTEDLNIYAVGRRTFRFSTGEMPKTNMGDVYQYWIPYSTSTDYVTSIKIPNSTAITGWTFVGYIEANDATSAVTYAASKQDTSVKPSPTSLSALDFRSVYSRTLTLTYDANGGTGSITKQNVTQYQNTGFGNGTSNVGSCVSMATIKLASSGFTKTGYALSKWAEDSASGTKHELGSDFIWKTTAGTEIKMYAIWVANTYKVSFNLNGGTGTTPSEVNATYGDAMPKITTAAPTKAGQKLMGWYDNSDYTKGTKYYNADGTSAHSYDKAKAATMYAGWAPDSFTVTFDLNGGTGTAPSSVSATYGSAMPKLTTTAPTMNNRTFMGWYNNADYTKGTQYYKVDGTSAKNCDFTENTKLYAGWKVQGTEVNVASFNVAYFGCGSTYTCTHTGNDARDDVVQLMKDHSINIGGFQEAKDFANGTGSDKISYISSNTTLTNKYVTITGEENINAILSKYALKNTTNYDLRGWRKLQKAEVSINNVTISIYNTHFALSSCEGCNEDNWEFLADKITNDPNPVIVTGDFNYRPITRYNTYLKNLGVVVAAHDTLNHNMNNGPHYMDSIFIRPYGSDNVNHIEILSSETVDTFETTSDHNMLVTKLSIY